MEIKINNYLINEKKISFTIKNNSITGLISNNIKLNSINKYAFIKRISLVKEIENNKYNNTVYEVILNEIKSNSLSFDNISLKKLFKIINLDFSYIERSYESLSSKEKILISIALSLLKDSDVLVLYNIFKKIDLIAKKQIMLLIKKFQEDYKKTILIISDNYEDLYKYTTDMIIIDDDKIYEDKTNDIYINNNISNIPKIIEFRNLLYMKKNIKLSYHKDVRDLLKDIYKHI